MGTAASIKDVTTNGAPKPERVLSGLEMYTGLWGKEQAAHLLRRALFGAREADIGALVNQTMSHAVDLLVSAQPEETSMPQAYDSADPAGIGGAWANHSSRDPVGSRSSSLKAWWIGLMLDQPLSIREKMVLFWHNHFVTSIGVVGDPRFSYRYFALLRRYALGNFKDLTRQMTMNGAMLRYLNGNTNTKTSPNENYGRELQELFTIGKGPEVAPGDYTNYTEDDVKAAARVLTGWRDDSTQLSSPGSIASYFDPSRHDTGPKQFSGRYGNATVAGRSGADGAHELNDLLDIIFAQPETARAICRELYRWFVYYEIDAAAEANVIEPMGSILRANNYELLPVVTALLKSAHFFDPMNIGAMIKSPLDFTVGLFRQFDVGMPTGDVISKYQAWNHIVSQSSGYQQNPGDPPNVAGWPAYHQYPLFYKLWITSDTLRRRNGWTDQLVYSAVTTQSGWKMYIDIMEFAKNLPNPRDPIAVVNDAATYLFAIAVTEKQKEFLLDTLLPGLPEYEWTDQWDQYTVEPWDPKKAMAVRSKLQALISTILRMPEYQLS